MSELKSLQRSQSIWTNFQKARTISEHDNIFLRFKLFYSIVYINISEIKRHLLNTKQCTILDGCNISRESHGESLEKVTVLISHTNIEK